MDHIYCTQCGTENNAGEKFCKKCRAELKSSPSLSNEDVSQDISDPSLTSEGIQQSSAEINDSSQNEHPYTEYTEYSSGEVHDDKHAVNPEQTTIQDPLSKEQHIRRIVGLTILIVKKQHIGRIVALTIFTVIIVELFCISLFYVFHSDSTFAELQDAQNELQNAQLKIKILQNENQYLKQKLINLNNTQQTTNNSNAIQDNNTMKTGSNIKQNSTTSSTNISSMKTAQSINLGEKLKGSNPNKSIIYNKDGEEVWADSSYTWDESIGYQTDSFDVPLDSGAYYLRIGTYESGTSKTGGVYSIIIC